MHEQLFEVNLWYESKISLLHRVLHIVTIDYTDSVQVCLLNCKHDGTSFWNHLHVSPIRNADGKVGFLQPFFIDVIDGIMLVRLDAMQSQALVIGVPYLLTYLKSRCSS